jgi:hypothetical protein
MPEVKNVLAGITQVHSSLQASNKYILHFRHQTSTFFTSGITQVHTSLNEVCTCVMPEVKYALV